MNANVCGIALKTMATASRRSSEPDVKPKNRV